MRFLSQKHVLHFVVNILPRLLLGVVFVIASAVMVFGRPEAPAKAAINATINYQGKLTNASYVAVADGTYNMEFKLYDALSSGTLLWTETRTGGNKVQVTNGLFNVMLGEVNNFTGFNFNQTLYLTVNIGGTGTPTWDGEMSPRKKIGAVPAAFLANTLEGTGKIDLINTSTNQAIIGYDASNKLSVGVASNGFTTLTVAGTGAGLNLTGGNVGIGTSTVSAKLHVTATSEQFRTSYDASNYTSFTTNSGGDLTIAPSGNDLAITGNVDVSGTFTSGTSDAFVVNASGQVTAGTWQGTAINNTYVSDTLTVDSSSSVHWNALNNYPAACSAGSAISQLADSTNTCTSFNTDTSITLQDAYSQGNTISTSGSNIAFTLNSSQGLTVTTAAAATGFTTFSLADGSNATPPAQLVQIDNADVNQAVASGLKITAAAGGITSALDLTDTDIGDAIALGNNNITGAGYSVTSTASGLTLNSTGAALALTTTTSGNITFAPAGTGTVQFTSGVTTGTGTTAGLYVTSTTQTSGDMIALNHATSTNTGTGLKMNFANGSGAFTGNFADFQVNGTSRFKIGSGTVTTSGASAVAGTLQDLVMNNSTTSGFQFGNRLLNTVSSTVGGTHDGLFIRMTDSTSLSTNQIVRGIEVQAYSGTNNNGINTGIQTYGKTFGISAETTGQAGGVFIPAAVFADLNNGSAPTLGNAIRAFSDNATSADLVNIYHSDSAYTGNALSINMGNIGSASGSFIGNFADFQYRAASKLKIAYSSSTDKITQTFSATGSILDLASGTNGNTFVMKIPQKATTGTCGTGVAEGMIFQNTGGTQVGHICISGPSAGSANKLNFYAESFNATSTDLAENYTDLTNSLEAGDVVKIDSAAVKAVKKSAAGDKGVMAGVISTSPGVLLSGIDETNRATDLVHPKPLALAGRVPVKVTNENGEIKPGDFLTTSNTLAGYAMKATEPGYVIGQALDSMSSSIGKVETFVKPTYFTGFSIDTEDDGLAFDNNQGDEDQNIPEFETDEDSVNGIEGAAESGALSINSSAIFPEGLRVDSISAINGLIAFRSDVEFIGRPYFTTDTAGFAEIKEGDRKVVITFDREYLTQPIVNASVSMEGSQDDQMSDLQDEMAQLLFEENIQYLVVNKSINGFTIIMNKAAPRDLKFSWTAFAVKNPKLFLSNNDSENAVGDESNSIVEEEAVVQNDDEDDNAEEQVAGATDESETQSESDEQNSIETN